MPPLNLRGQCYPLWEQCGSPERRIKIWNSRCRCSFYNQYYMSCFTVFLKQYILHQSPESWQAFYNSKLFSKKEMVRHSSLFLELCVYIYTYTYIRISILNLNNTYWQDTVVFPYSFLYLYINLIRFCKEVISQSTISNREANKCFISTHFKDLCS